MPEFRRKLLLLDYCMTPHERIEKCGILCEHGRVIGFGGASAFQQDAPGLQVLRFPNAYATPGLIDTHVHGYSARYQGLCNFDMLENMSLTLAKHGVTSFCPTLVSQPANLMPAIVESLYENIIKDYKGAEPVAIHLEGPFINPEKCGDQPHENVALIDIGYAKELIAAGHGKIKVMTFAPELPHAKELIELMLENGILPSMGHSLASGEETIAAIDAGARRCTYIFNGMPSLYHRTSSLTATALTDDRVAIEMIADGVHLHPAIIDLIVRCKPADKIIGISNAVLFPDEDDMDETRGIVINQSGIIVGAAMTLEHTWLQLNHYSKMSKDLAAACITSNPATDLGLVTRGAIYPGKFADIAIFDASTNELQHTIRRGEFIYSKNNSIIS